VNEKAYYSVIRAVEAQETMCCLERRMWLRACLLVDIQRAV